MNTKLHLISALAASLTLHGAAMPTEAEVEKAVPKVERMLASEKVALASGKMTRAEVAAAAMKLAADADDEAAKLLLMKGAFILHVKDGDLEKAVKTMNALETAIADMPPQIITNIIETALLGLPNKAANGARLYQLLDESKSNDGNSNSIRIQLSSDCEMTFCYCPAGSFTMGYVECPNLSKVREVKISRPFWITKMPVTVKQVEALGVKAIATKNGYAQFENYQTLGVDLAEKLKQKYLGIPKGYEFRLPTEAELEYVMKAGTEPGDLRREWGFNDKDGVFNHPWGLSSDIYKLPIVCVFDRGPKWGGSRCFTNEKNANGGFWTNLTKIDYENQPSVDPLGWSYDSSWQVLRRESGKRKLSSSFGKLISNNDYYVLAPEEKLLNKFLWDHDAGERSKTLSSRADETTAAVKDSSLAVHAAVESIMKGMIKVPGRDFWLSATEVTQEQWEPIMEFNLSEHKGAKLPVECVSPDDCDVFLEKLNQTKEVQTSQFDFALPSRDEWQYAAQAGSGANCSWIKPGVVGNALDMAWYRDNGSNQTHVVATKAANAFGLYDMLGNVWEWMLERDDKGRRYRYGGSFYETAGECSVSRWISTPRSRRYNHCGLRLAAHKKARLLGGLRRLGTGGGLLRRTRRQQEAQKTIHQEIVDGYTWSFRVNSGEAEIVADGKSRCAISPKPTGHIAIPLMLGGAKVMSIGKDAFKGCGALTSLAISENVRSIEQAAFYGCGNLTSVTIPKGVKSIGGEAFYDCGGLTSITMCGERPDAPSNVFRGCTNLKVIHVSANCKSWAGMKEWQGIPLVFDAK